MRRVFSFLMAAVVVLSVLGITGTAHAAGSLAYIESRFVWGKGVVFIFEGTSLKNKDLKGAILFIESSDYKLSCWVNKDEGKVICVASGGLTQYAGEAGVITLAGRTFTVIIPGRTIPVHNESISCPEGTVPGANVTFETGGGDTFTTFVSGASRSEVQDNAESQVDGSDFVDILSIGNLYCSEIPQ
jgi:hypothetical protein